MVWGAQGGFSSIQDNVIAFRTLMTAAASNGRDVDAIKVAVKPLHVYIL